jgi:hypothetical protein
MVVEAILALGAGRTKADEPRAPAAVSASTIVLLAGILINWAKVRKTEARYCQRSG